MQGVSFRAATEERAREAGLAGWVANRDDGSVEVVAEGPPDALDGLADWLAHGPSQADVDEVSGSDDGPPQGLDGFRQG